MLDTVLRLNRLT